MLLSENHSMNMARKGISTHFFPSSKTLSSSSSFSSSAFPISPFPSPPPAPPLSHTFSESMIDENIENAESIISKWDPDSSSINKITSLFHHNRKEAKEFLKSVKDLRQTMHFLIVSEQRASHKLVLAQNLMQIAMKRLEKELYQILSICRNQLDPESVSSGSSDGTSSSFGDDDEVDSDEEIQLVGESITKAGRVTTRAMSDLKSIADCMISSGYGKECIKIYKLIRKSIVDEALYMLGIERFRSSQVQKMVWESLDHMIKNWQNAVKIAVKTLFHGEKLLCDHVFSASKTVRESCFAETTKDGAANLFRFPELIAKKKKSPERIFSLIQLYEALSDVWPETQLIFTSEATSSVKLQAHTSMLKLGNSVRTTLSDFESSIQKNSSKTRVAGGGIHQLTRSSMSYISSLGEHSAIISKILADSTPAGNELLPQSYFESPTSQDGSTTAVSVRLARLILVLLCKLDTIAELYKDVSLSYLFLVNNLVFIVEKVYTTNLKAVLGEDWLLKHVKKVRQYVSNYETIAWAKVFSSLPEKNSPPLSPEAAKECFRGFNAAFEEAYKKQTSWVVTEGKLREEMKASIAKKIVPVYKEFYDTHLVMLSGEKNLELLARFFPDDLGNYLSDLFHGVAVSDIYSSTSTIGCMPR